MINVWLLIAIAIASYFFGNINWAIIISKLKKTDIRKMGSGNPGTLNMSRNLGLKAGLLTFFLDICKGAIPALIAHFVFKNKFFIDTQFEIRDFAVFLCGFCAVIGHIYPVFLKFKGGKGIASTIGVFIATQATNGSHWYVVIIMSLVAAAVFIYFTEFGAMGSFIAITPPAIASSIYLFLRYSNFTDKTSLIFNLVTNLLIFGICLITWFAHRNNIKRMLAGEEHPTSIKEMVVKMKSKKSGGLFNKIKIATENIKIKNKDKNKGKKS